MTRAAAACALVLLCAAAARGQDQGADEQSADILQAELALSLRVFPPKFRFRDGEAGLVGSSMRTQKLGLDGPTLGPAGRAGVWLFERDWIGGRLWLARGDGDGRLGVPVAYNGATIPAGASIRTEFHLTHAALEYLHRFEPTSWLWVAAGAQLDFMTFRVAVAGAGRTELQALWPTLRVAVGVRPLEWLELVCQAGGFEVTVPLTHTVVSQALELDVLVRLHLPWEAFVEVGASLLHAHLEEHPGDAREDALHLRARTLQVGVGVRF